VIVFDAGLALDPEFDPVLALDPELEELHAARAVQAATTRTAHPEIRLRIGEPSLLGYSETTLPLVGRVAPRIAGNVTVTDAVMTMGWTGILREALRCPP